jgi:predicted kinase
VKLIMLRGIQGSGKSTWAKEQVDAGNGNVKRVNNDELRLMVDNGHWSPKNEKIITAIRCNMVEMLLRLGYDVIIDNMNLTKHHEDEARRMANVTGAEFEIKEFNLDVEECIIRDALRPNPIGEEVIRKTYKNHYQR